MREARNSASPNREPKPPSPSSSLVQRVPPPPPPPETPSFSLSIEQPRAAGAPPETASDLPCLLYQAASAHAGGAPLETISSSLPKSTISPMQRELRRTSSSDPPETGSSLYPLLSRSPAQRRELYPRTTLSFLSQLLSSPPQNQHPPLLSSISQSLPTAPGTLPERQKQPLLSLNQASPHSESSPRRITSLACSSIQPPRTAGAPSETGGAWQWRCVPIRSPLENWHHPVLQGKGPPWAPLLLIAISIARGNTKYEVYYDELYRRRTSTVPFSMQTRAAPRNHVTILQFQGLLNPQICSWDDVS